MFINRLFFLLVTAFLFTAMPPATFAQDAPTSSDALAEIMKQAAENGVSVVVVDSSGNVLSAGATAEPEEEPVSETSADRMSTLMKAQTKVDGFRALLKQRLNALPAALNEVEFILRASSPTGQIWAFVETALWTIGLLLVGHQPFEVVCS